MMSRIYANMILSAVSIAALTLAQPTLYAAQPNAEAATTAESTPVDPGWPRIFEKDGVRVVIHQPQIDEWTNFSTIRLRSAVQVFETPDAESAYGIIDMTAKTRVDKEERLVLLTEPQLQIRFPEATTEGQAHLEGIVRGLLPGKSSLEISLDRVLAHFDELHLSQERGRVNIDPPPIFYSSSPAALLIFMGEPRFKPIEGTTLMFAINTNWDVILDSATSTYYIRNDSAWLSTQSITEGPFENVGTLPTEFRKIPSDENWADVHAAIPPKASALTPRVFVSTVPAELILTNGEPEYSAIPGTSLMYIANTDMPVILDSKSRTNYLLIAGRWFNAPDLKGPWVAATNSLPTTFASIPEDSPIAFVRASVPGTDEAQEAVLLASVPDKATINRKEATIDVAYDGEPKFKPIETTTIQYAVNTTYDVFAVDGKYYCCHEGVWFVGGAPKGPWEVCASVPNVIYTIPTSHPAHNVTYVYVYDSTPETVTVGSTSGYKGEYVVGGLLLFGAGMLVGAAIADDDDDWYSYHYRSCHYSYGCGAVYHGAYGGYYRGAKCYGPYGGAGAGAVYNPRTGGWARGAYAYGPSGAAFARSGYNPWTNTGYAQAGRSTPYGSWSRGVAVRDDEWVRGGTSSNARGSAGWVETSKGSGAVHLDPTRGGQGTIAKDQQGNVYVGKDGNVYRRDESGTWNQRQNGGWQSTQQPTRPTPTGQPTTTGTQNRPASHQDLEQQRQAREKGNARANSYSQSRSQFSGRSGGRSGGGGRGRR
jgi:hypothetical protein